jgi:hypothetical protein
MYQLGFDRQAVPSTFFVNSELVLTIVEPPSGRRELWENALPMTTPF